MSEVTVEERKIEETTREKEITVCDRDGCDLTSEDDVEFVTLLSQASLETVVDLELSEVNVLTDSLDGELFDTVDEAEEAVSDLNTDNVVFGGVPTTQSEEERAIEEKYQFRSIEKVSDMNSTVGMHVCERCVSSLFTDLDPSDGDVSVIADYSGVTVEKKEEKNPLLTVTIEDNVLYWSVLASIGLWILLFLLLL
jgi:hypothetical protein